MNDDLYSREPRSQSVTVSKAGDLARPSLPTATGMTSYFANRRYARERAEVLARARLEGEIAYIGAQVDVAVHIIQTQAEVIKNKALADAMVQGDQVAKQVHVNADAQKNALLESTGQFLIAFGETAASFEKKVESSSMHPGYKQIATQMIAEMTVQFSEGTRDRTVSAAVNIDKRVRDAQSNRFSGK